MYNWNISLSDPQDCSVGQLICPLSESNRINGGGGTYFLPDEVLCNGNLVSLHTCFFYNDEGDRNNNNFQLRVRVFRRMGDNYIRVDGMTINKMRETSSETQGCASRNLRNPLPVMKGDRIAVRVRNQCGNQPSCPLQPNLNVSGSASVFFTSGSVDIIPVSQVMATESYTNVYLDVSVSIGEFNIFRGSRTSKVIVLRQTWKLWIQ